MLYLKIVRYIMKNRKHKRSLSIVLASLLLIQGIGMKSAGIHIGTEPMTAAAIGVNSYKITYA